MSTSAHRLRRILVCDDDPFPADWLAVEGIAFPFLSEYQADILRERHRGRSYMARPLREPELLAILRDPPAPPAS